MDFCEIHTLQEICFWALTTYRSFIRKTKNIPSLAFQLMMQFTKFKRHQNSSVRIKTATDTSVAVQLLLIVSASPPPLNNFSLPPSSAPALLPHTSFKSATLTAPLVFLHRFHPSFHLGLLVGCSKGRHLV